MKKRIAWMLVVCLSVLAGTALFLVACHAEEPVASVSSAPAPEVKDKSDSSKQDELEKQRLAREAELKEPFWAVIMGGDARENTTDGEPAEHGTYSLRYSDTLMLLRIWPDEGKVTLLTIPRDTRATTGDGQIVKINEFLRWRGAEGATEYFEQLMGIDIKYYFATDFARFVDAIDLLGGVDIISPINMHFTGIVYDTAPYDLTEGENHLDGEGALGFARARKVYANDQDACRQIQDRQIIQRIIEAGSATSDETREVYLKAVDSFVDTNISAEDLAFYANLFASQSGALEILSGSMPYSGYIMEDTQQWMVPYDEAVWQEIIDTVVAGGDPNTIVPLPYVAAG